MSKEWPSGKAHSTIQLLEQELSLAIRACNQPRGAPQGGHCMRGSTPRRPTRSRVISQVTRQVCKIAQVSVRVVIMEFPDVHVQSLTFVKIKQMVKRKFHALAQCGALQMGTVTGQIEVVFPDVIWRAAQENTWPEPIMQKRSARTKPRANEPAQEKLDKQRPISVFKLNARPPILWSSFPLQMMKCMLQNKARI